MQEIQLPPLSPPLYIARRLFAKHVIYSIEHSSNVMFTDESRSLFKSYVGRVIVQ